MLTITLSDLMYRRRQFLIAVVGAALVFAMTLLLAGLTNGFGVEIDQSVAGFGADAWVVYVPLVRKAAFGPAAERPAELVGVWAAGRVGNRSALTPAA